MTLNITQLGETQSNKYITINNAIAALEQAGNHTFENLAVGGSDTSVNVANFTRHMAFVFAGLTGNRSVSFPTTVGGITTERVFVVENRDTTDTLTINSGGTTVVVPPSSAVVVFQVGTNTYKVSDTTPALAVSYPADIGVFLPGKPADNDLVVVLRVPRACTMPDNFAGSYGYCAVNPTSTAVFNIAKNGTPIGTISITSGGTFTFNTTGSGVETFAAGDRISITAPTPQDATLEDVSMTFIATRTG